MGFRALREDGDNHHRLVTTYGDGKALFADIIQMGDSRCYRMQVTGQTYLQKTIQYPGICTGAASSRCTRYRRLLEATH